jgi:hypothetical protein
MWKNNVWLNYALKLSRFQTESSNLCKKNDIDHPPHHDITMLNVMAISILLESIGNSKHQCILLRTQVGTSSVINSAVIRKLVKKRYNGSNV